jgi:hypothetical protein
MGCQAHASVTDKQFEPLRVGIWTELSLSEYFNGFVE